MQSSVRKWSAFADVAEQLASSRTTDAIVSVLRNSSRDLAGCDGIAVVLRDGDECRYVAEDAHSPLWSGQSFPMATCISGLSMLSDRTIVIPDVLADARVPHASYAPTFVRSMVMVPIGRPAPVAALGAYWATTGTPPGETVATLEGLAKVATSSFENVRLIKSLREAQDHANLLADELSHRLGNTFTIVRALALRSLGGGSVNDGPVDAFLDRLNALGQAHRVLLGQEPQADLGSILAQTLKPFADGSAQVIAEGPYVALPAKTAISLTMGLHELATNSVKYGALSSPTGSLDVRWSLDQTSVAPLFHLTWQERGGPRVQRPSRRGFGSRLIEMSLSHELGATVELDFAAEGLTAHLSAQISIPTAPDEQIAAA